MDISQLGIDVIKMFESFRDRIYLDSAGKPTIGWGHLIKPGESFDEPISDPIGENLLKADLQEAINAVNSMVKTPLAQFQFDALVSLVFNIGSGNFQNSTMLQKLNSNQIVGASAEFLKWNKAGGKFSPGLARRRKAEMVLFLGGNMDGIKLAYNS